MRIALVTDTFLPQINGIATYVANIAEEFGKKGHEVLVIAPKTDHADRKSFKAKNVTVCEVASVPVDFIYTEFKVPVMGLPKVLLALKEFRPDIIHFQMPLPLGIDSILTSKVLNVPLVATLHTFMTTPDYLLAVIPEKLVNKSVTDFVMGLSNFMYSAADLRISVSKELVVDLKKAGYKKEVKFIPCGVSLSNIVSKNSVDLKKLKKSLGLDPVKKTVLHFGRLSDEKMVNEVIKAFSMLKEKKSQLLIIGDGPARKNLQELSRKVGVEDRTIFTGFIDHQKLLSDGILYCGDVFVTASTTENNPMVVLESVAHGLPIVGVSAGGLKSQVDGNGILVKPHDVSKLASSIEKVLSSTELSKKYSNKSFELAKEKSTEHVAESLLQEYKVLMTKHRP